MRLPPVRYQSFSGPFVRHPPSRAGVSPAPVETPACQTSSRLDARRVSTAAQIRPRQEPKLSCSGRFCCADLRFEGGRRIVGARLTSDAFRSPKPHLSGGMRVRRRSTTRRTLARANHTSVHTRHEETLAQPAGASCLRPIAARGRPVRCAGCRRQSVSWLSLEHDLAVEDDRCVFGVGGVLGPAAGRPCENGQPHRQSRRRPLPRRRVTRDMRSWS